VTRHYFLEGLKKLLTHKSVEHFIEKPENFAQLIM